MVAHPPSCPVLRAVRTSRTSGPRHSPRTRRSGRMRMAARTRSDRVTAPRPSTFGLRSRRWTQCGWAGATSATSSMHTMRSEEGTRERAALRRVVLPLPVAPETRTLAREATSARRSGPSAPGSVPQASRSAIPSRRVPSTRREMSVPDPEMGGRTACRRTPPGRVPSAMGLASSRRAPHALASRIAAWRASASSWMPTSTRASPPPRSAHA